MREREEREGGTGGETSTEREACSLKEREQRCVSPFSPPSVQLLSTSLFISPSFLHLSVRPSRLLHCWHMTDPGKDVEVPCGQES